MSNITRHALRVYSALGELRGNDADVLDALIPFFEPILEVMNGKVFDPRVFSAGVRKLYKWRFTGDIAESFIPRFERKKMLKKVASADNGSVWVVTFEASGSTADAAPIANIFAKIVDEFEVFPRRVTDLLSYSKTREELEDLLVRFLVSMDSPGEGAYSPQLGDMDPGGQAATLLSQLDEGGRPLHPDDRYMCARFVRHLMKTKPEYIPQMARLASIALLAEVVEDFLKPTNQQIETDLTIILDAPLALDLLGCSGIAFRDDIHAIIAPLKAIGAKFIVFPTSCLEMQRNLRSMLSLPTTSRHGYTHNAMIRREVREDFVKAVANNPEQALANAGITVRQMSLENQPNSHRYFTAEHYEDFYSSLTWGNVQGREHDATCAALVMRLREGKHSSDIFRCRYVMVTRNSTFVRRARDYCLQNRMIDPLREGPVIFQRELATTAWLRTGLGADDSIPRGHLITSCDRVLQMRPELRQALATHLAAITPERLEQFNLLLQDARSVQKLADQTLNNENVVTAENAEMLLEVMREATVQELKEKYDSEREAERTATRKAKEGYLSQLTEMSRKLEMSGARDKERQERTDKSLEVVAAQINKSALRIELSSIALLVALCALGGVNYFTGWLDDHWVWKWVPIAAAAVGLIRLVYGILQRPMPGLIAALEFVARRRIERELRVRNLDEIDAARFSIKAGRVELAPLLSEQTQEVI